MAEAEVRNVLVVEDDKSTMDIISRALQRDGHRVTMSLSMEDALLGFERLPYDLVIADIFMIGMGGIAGIQKMRELRPEIKIIATSAGFSETTPKAALEAAEKIGAAAVLPKPFGLDELRELVNGVLAGD